MSAFFSKKITRVSFILSICIIIYHATNTSVYPMGLYNPLNILESFLSTIISIAVPTFFIISGFLYYHNCNSLNSCLKKAKKRGFTLLLPYLTFCCIYTIYFLCLYNVPFLKDKLNNSYNATLSAENILHGLLFAKYSGILWYVRNLIVLTIISPLIYYSLKIKPISYLILAGLFVIYFIEPNFLSFNYLQIFSWCWYYLGAVLSTHIKDFKKLTTKHSLTSLLLGLTLSTILCIFNMGLFNIVIPANILFYTNKIFLPLMIVCFWFAFDLFVSNKTIRIEKISFFIYCTHSLILESIQKTIFLLGNNSFIFAVIDYILSPAVTFCIIIAFALFLNRFLPKVFYILSGGRTLPTKSTTSNENAQ